ncbi:MAG: choice-of-anchor D domain-containing protein, partial [Taibaiella sp.]|nr:choice-of-anchor D domain-containing protein [Taibaiella sp.]
STAEINVIRVELADPANPNFTLTKPSLPVVVPGNGQLTFPVSFRPQTEGIHEVDVILEIEGLSPALTGKLTGIGFLPKISADDVLFPGTRVGDPATPIDIVIKNDCEYGNLFISEISIATQPNFSFGTTALTNITIPKNGEHRIPVNFTPSAAGLLEAQVTIKNDAVGGPEPITQQILNVNVTGSGLRLDVVDKLEFGSLSTCSTLRKGVSITNPGADAITFNGTITGTDIGAFDLEASSLNIPGGGTSEFGVIFKPTQSKNYSANLVITSAAGDAEIPLTGTGTVIPFSSKWKSSSMNIEVAKELETEFTTEIPNLSPTTISQIIYHLTYNPQALKYNKTIG